MIKMHLQMNMKMYILILQKKLKNTLKIPFAFKLGSHFTNLVGFIQKIKANVPGVVLFNRFYAPDIDIDKLEFTSSEVFSSPADIRNSLRWVGIISSKVKNVDIAASTGVHDGKAVIKQFISRCKCCSSLFNLI